jgi:uncharacterized membrane protein YfcA
MGPELALLYITLGFLGGLVAGLLGVGGGIVFVPLFSQIFKGESISETNFPALIIAHSLCLTLLSAFSASIRNFYKQNFFLNKSLITGLSGILTGLATSYAISNFKFYSKEVFSIVFSILLIPVILKMFSRKNKAKDHAPADDKPSTKFVLPGFAAGIVSALSGLGGGIVMVPILHNWFKKSIPQASSISLGAIFIMSASMVLYYLSIDPLAPATSFTIGTIRADLIVAMSPGVLIGAPFGVKLANQIRDVYIKFCFAIFASIVLIKTLFF